MNFPAPETQGSKTTSPPPLPGNKQRRCPAIIILLCIGKDGSREQKE